MGYGSRCCGADAYAAASLLRLAVPKDEATMPTVGKEDEPLTPAQMAINTVKVFFALSPLLALFYVLLSGFESEDKEKAKRIKKGFSLDGHAE